MTQVYPRVPQTIVMISSLAQLSAIPWVQMCGVGGQFVLWAQMNSLSSSGFERSSVHVMGELHVGGVASTALQEVVCCALEEPLNIIIIRIFFLNPVYSH